MIRENQNVFNICNVLLDILVLVISVFFLYHTSMIQHRYPISFYYTTLLSLFILLIPSYLNYTHLKEQIEVFFQNHQKFYK